LAKAVTIEMWGDSSGITLRMQAKNAQKQTNRKHH